MTIRLAIASACMCVHVCVRKTMELGSYTPPQNPLRHRKCTYIDIIYIYIAIYMLNKLPHTYVAISYTVGYSNSLHSLLTISLQSYIRV